MTDPIDISIRCPGILARALILSALITALWPHRAFGDRDFDFPNNQPVVRYINEDRNFYNDRYLYRPGSGPWEFYPGPWNPIHSIWISSFTASPSFVVRGQPVQLTWSAPGAQTVAIDGVGGNFGPSGAATVVPSVSTTYQLHAYGFQGQQVAASVYVQVLEPSARIVNFQVNPLNIRRGESSFVTWNVEDCQVVQLIVSGDSNGAGSYGCSGQLAVQPQSSSSYSLQAIGRDGQIAQSGPFYVSVNIPPPAPQIEYFRAQNLTLTRGESTLIEWSVSQTPSVLIMGLDYPQQPSIGSVRVTPLETKTYVLRVPSAQGAAAESSITITVEDPIPLPQINRFDVNPPSVERGQAMTLSWQVDYCVEVTIEGTSQGRSFPCAGSIDVTPEQSTDFRLIARNRKGQASYKSIYVPVSQPPAWPVIWNFRSESPEVIKGQPIRLSWETTDAVRVELASQDFTLEEPLSGTIVLYPEQTANYELRAYNVRNQMTSSRLIVNVRPPERPAIESFQADQPIAIAPNPLRLSWRTRHCLSVEIPGIMAPFAGNIGTFTYTPRQKKEDLILRCQGETGEIIEAGLTVRALPEGSTTDDAIEALLGYMGAHP